jgi:hypothetical protein
MPKTLRFAAFALLCVLGATAGTAAHAHPVAFSQPASAMCTTCWT